MNAVNLYLQQHVRDFTRIRGNDDPSLLDLVITRDELEVESLKHMAPIGSSEHCVLYFLLSIDMGELEGSKEYVRNFCRGDLFWY